MRPLPKEGHKVEHFLLHVRAEVLSMSIRTRCARGPRAGHARDGGRFRAGGSERTARAGPRGSPEAVRVSIIGAGVAGLNLRVRARRARCAVEIIERSASSARPLILVPGGMMAPGVELESCDPVIRASVRGVSLGQERFRHRS